MSSKAKAESHRALTADMSKLALPRSELERDCAFSDTSSGYLSAVDQTDTEDTGRASAAQKSQAGTQVAVVTGPYPNLSPMIIMNNVVLKQPNATAPAVKPWGFQPALEVLPQPQVVFLQPVLSSGDGASANRAPNKQRTGKYLPILKSYPKIAPYPGESLSDKSRSSSSERSAPAPSHGGGRHRRRHHRDKQLGHTADSSDSVKPAPPAPANHGPVSPRQNPVPSDDGDVGIPASTNPPSAIQGRSQAPPHSLAASPLPIPQAGAPEALASPCKWPVVVDCATEVCRDAPLDGINKRKRFCNTYNILHRSGLLGITLRTKELIRLNRRTQGQLDHLREQTSLLMQAVHSGDPQVWARLQLTLLEAPPDVEEEEQTEAGLEKGAQDGCG